MKLKVIYHVLPSRQTNLSQQQAHQSERTLTKTVEVGSSPIVSMREVLSQLAEGASKGGMLENRMVSYKNRGMNAWVYIGNFWHEKPAKTHDIREACAIQVPLEDLKTQDDQGTDCIQLKFRERAKGEYSDALINGQAEMSKGSRRTKERKIGEVILAVKRWRELYTMGEKLAEGNQFHTLSLEDAATKVGISKKSLDDYFLQLKNGQKNGFNFNEHKNDKIGILRAYNKKNKKSEPMTATSTAPAGKKGGKK